MGKSLQDEARYIVLVLIFHCKACEVKDESSID